MTMSTEVRSRKRRYKKNYPYPKLRKLLITQLVQEEKEKLSSPLADRDKENRTCSSCTNNNQSKLATSDMLRNACKRKEPLPEWMTKIPYPKLREQLADDIGDKKNVTTAHNEMHFADNILSSQNTKIHETTIIRKRRVVRRRRRTTKVYNDQQKEEVCRALVLVQQNEKSFVTPTKKKKRIKKEELSNGELTDDDYDPNEDLRKKNKKKTMRKKRRRCEEDDDSYRDSATQEDYKPFKKKKKNEEESIPKRRYNTRGKKQDWSFLLSKKSFNEDHYYVLGLKMGDKLDAIKMAYKKLALLYHPDRKYSLIYITIFNKNLVQIM